MLSGDESACNEVKALVPNMEVAAVKTVSNEVLQVD